MTMSSSSSSAPTHEVHLAIYDLSMGMARSLSSQFLGPQHAVEIIPHTAIIAYGKEYYFGQGIEWCTPHEFRATRGIHPIELQPLGRTACTEREFEEWCRARAADGTFGPTSYDFFHKNCNNFSEEAARRGLRLARGVPRWILDLPQKFLSSPMGVAVRPLLEQMQITNTAPTIAPRGGSRGATMPPAFAPAPAAPAAAAAHAANPWANIPAAASATTPQSTSTAPEKSTGCKPATPLLDKQTALLSTDTGVVKTCIDRLKPEEESTCKLLSKLADANASWTRDRLDTVHRYLQPIVENDARHASFALMLLRLAVLRRPSGEEGRSEEPSRSAQLVAHSLIDGETTSPASRSVAWCALSNAAGSADPPDWNVSSHTGCYNLVQVVDRALGDCDPSADGASSGSHASLRRSAAAFLYNASRLLAEGDGGGDDAGPDLLSEGAMSVLLGCLERLREETDVEASRRLYMAVGQLLKSSKSGAAARSLVQDLDLFDDEMSKGKNKEVEGLAGEVASLLR